MPNNLPANPLQRLIGTVARSTPKDTGESTRFRSRYSATGTNRLILCDVSDSMSYAAGAGKRRIDHLRGALDQVVRPEHVLIAFASSAKPFATPADLPSPGGGTALELGFVEAMRFDPAATLVISDGEPNVPATALHAAEALPGTIDVIFCGDEANTEAVKFMRELARLGCGRYAYHSWVRQTGPQLADTMRLMLRGPG